MSEDLEHVQARLGNISAVEPILGALRTISLGAWQGALKRQKSVQQSSQQFLGILRELLPYLPQPEADSGREELGVRRILALSLGSERGLCGGFNMLLAQYMEEYLQAQADVGVEVELWGMGSRLGRALARHSITLAHLLPMSITALPQYRVAYDLTRRWLARYEANEIDRVEVIYNAYGGVAHYKPVVLSLIPPDISLSESDLPVESSWPTPIIDTDPVSLYNHTIEQMTAIQFYQCLLESTASEQSARYQLMEEATTNAERLISEMTEIVQMYRRQRITQEMQELAAGAGFLGKGN